MQADERVKRVRRGLLWLSVAALVLGALPLYAISLYNHPYYDDYGFSAKAHQAWRDTGSVGAVLRAAWESALETRQSWQGTYNGHAAEQCAARHFFRAAVFHRHVCAAHGIYRVLFVLFCCGVRTAGHGPHGPLDAGLPGGHADDPVHAGRGRSVLLVQRRHRQHLRLLAHGAGRRADGAAGGVEGPRRGADGGAVRADGAFGRRQLRRRAIQRVHAGGVPGVDAARAASAAPALCGADGPAAPLLCLQACPLPATRCAPG